MSNNSLPPRYQNQQQPFSTKGGSCYSTSLHGGESGPGSTDVPVPPWIHHLPGGHLPANLCDQILPRWVGHRWCSLYPPPTTTSLSLSSRENTFGRHHDSTPCRRDSVENVTVWRRAAAAGPRHAAGASADQGATPLAPTRRCGRGLQVRMLQMFSRYSLEKRMRTVGVERVHLFKPENQPDHDCLPGYAQRKTF